MTLEQLYRDKVKIALCQTDAVRLAEDAHDAVDHMSRILHDLAVVESILTDLKIPALKPETLADLIELQCSLAGAVAYTIAEVDNLKDVDARAVAAWNQTLLHLPEQQQPTAATSSPSSDCADEPAPQDKAP